MLSHPRPRRSSKAHVSLWASEEDDLVAVEQHPRSQLGCGTTAFGLGCWLFAPLPSPELRYSVLVTSPVAYAMPCTFHARFPTAD
jgi:hypothetical protein